MAPEVYWLVQRLRRHQTTIYSGGLMAQPHMTMLEMEMVMSAENEMERIRLANAMLAAQTTSGK